MCKSAHIIFVAGIDRTYLLPTIFRLGGREALFGALALRFLLQVTEAFNTIGNAAFRIFAALIVQVEVNIIKPTLTRQIL